MAETDIVKVVGRRVWDSRGRPTVEAEVTLAGGAAGRAIAPAGASTGSGEAVDRRDGGVAFGGYDVTGAVDAVSGEIAGALAGLDSMDQETVDNVLIRLDGTGNKSRLGGNAMIATSLAVAHAAAAGKRVPLWRHLAGDGAVGTMPRPEIQLFGGGAHAGRRVDVQDFMIVATGARTFAGALDMTAEVYRAAGKLLAARGKLAGVADEGGYWPVFDTNEEALGLAVAAIEAAGYAPGDEVAISLDIAASDFGKGGRYRLAREDRELDTGAMIDMLLGWLDRYPIRWIEDPLAEDDEPGLIAFTAAAKGVAVVGDDYLVTNAARVRHAAEVGSVNTALIKPNQAGTLTETRSAFDAARAAGFRTIVSARSGETEDVSVAHLAVGWGAEMLKVGSFTRSERMAKWNEGLRIAEALGDPPLA
ncbi:MAG: phosphopyruvate hydratase [Bauldia sp.]|nr:phosphopyruvate hydratase [Bauldia sp.]